MNFLEKVKKVLIDQLQNKIESTTRKIEKLTEENEQEREKNETLSAEVAILAEEKSQLEDEKKRIDRNISYFNTLKKVMINYPRILRIIEEIEKVEEKYSEKNSENFESETEKKEQLCEDMKKLNATIKEINKHNKNFKLDEGMQTKCEDYLLLVERYYDLITRFPLVDGKAVNEGESYFIGQQIKTYETLKKEFGQDIDKILGDEIKDIQEVLNPFELWKEIENYYSNIKEIRDIIDEFTKNIDFYAHLAEFDENIFVPARLKAFLEYCEEKGIEYKKKDSEYKTKNSELQKRMEKEKKSQSGIESFSKQLKKAQERVQEIANAQSLQELDYKDKKDAAKKLKIDIKEYIVVPIPNDVQKISDLFNREKKMKVEIGGMSFYTSYTKDTAEGCINSFEEGNNSTAVLIVPIDSLRKEQIASVKNGKIDLTMDILKNKGIKAIVPEQRKINFEKFPINTTSYANGDILEQVKRELGEDYTDNPQEELDSYEILKNSPSISQEENKKRTEAIRNCLFENIQRDVKSEEEILVDGESYHLGIEDEKNLSYRDRKENIDEEKLKAIIDGIKKFLSGDEKKGESIDTLYQKLLVEYLRVEKKAKAEYYNEEKTTIRVNGRKMSIKPILPISNEKIASRYSRKGEDIAYKTIKLARIVNRFAHMVQSQNEDIADQLFDTKMSLINETLQMAENNPQINIKYEFDKEKMTDSIIVKIPGYNIIALHLMGKGDEMGAKVGKLERNTEEVLNSSVIMTSGVNEEFLREMQKMDMTERIQTLINLDSATLGKLAIKMGYDVNAISSQEERKQFIEDMISDKKIQEMIDEQEELEI